MLVWYNIVVRFLEENKNIKNELYFRLRLPDEQEIKFKVPVMKYWEYCAEDLKDKKMYALLPLQVFKSRKSIKAIYDNAGIRHEEKARLINNEFEKLIVVIKSTLGIVGELYSSSEIIGSDLEKILRVLTNITEYLYKKYGEYTSVSKEVENMVTTLYNPAIKEEGIREGMKKGIEKGMENLVIRLLKKKFSDIPEKYIKLIEDADEKTLLQIADNIFEINKIEDIEKYIVS